VKVNDLQAKLESFLADLEKHAQLWQRSLDDTMPDYPIANGNVLRQQSNALARQLGTLRPFIDKFGFPSILSMAGTQWDIYDSAVANDVAIRKGRSIEGVIPQLHQMLGRLDSMDPTSEFGKRYEEPTDTPPDATAESKPTTHQGPLVFISHSSKDEKLVMALVELLKTGLGLLANQIRCSSVDGNRLPVGVNTESKLREEVNAAKVVIGLITHSSLSSNFVMFELGARWGANLFLAPLVAGIRAGELSGPLRLLNALSANSEPQLCQLLADISKPLGLTLQDTSAYLRHVMEVKVLADAITSTPPNPVSANPVLQASEPEIKQVGTTNYYFVGDKGPYCQPCYDLNHKLITLMPGQDYVGGFGRKCEVCNKVFMEGPRKTRTPTTQVRGSGGQWN
jgi:hypothetical protein